MQDRQITLPDLPLRVDLRAKSATVRVRGEGSAGWSFRLHRVADLADQRAMPEILEKAGDSAAKPLLVHFERASPGAMRTLREHRISFLGESGACFLYSPPLVVDRELPSIAAPPTSNSAIQASERNPFGRRGSRVLRWLLLHPTEQFSMHELTRHTKLSMTLVSRVTHAMNSEAWIDLAPDPQDRRIRRVRMRRPRQALEAWGRAWDRRRIVTESWNIRADDLHEAMRRLKRVRKSEPELSWAVGGLAGASLFERVAEPATALLWVSRDDLDGLRAALAPTRSIRSHPPLRVAVAPDDYIFDLAAHRPGLPVPVVDKAQLWLDCSGEGERARQAADAIAGEMGW